MKIAGIGNAALPALGLMTLLGTISTGAKAQESAAPGTEVMRLYRLPLKNANTAFIVGKLNHVYYWTRPLHSGSPLGVQGNNPFSSGFGPPQGTDGMTFLKPSALRLDGMRFLIDNERDNSLLIEATPEGFNALRNIVTALDVPLTARAKHIAAKIAP